MNTDLKALPLVTVERGGQFRVPEEAQAFLRSIQRPIAVVSIAGAYRSGKSFLMNRLLLNRFSGFETGSTIHACTKGLWVWNQPMTVVTNDGLECDMLVIDSEGLGDTNEDANHDTRIYMLAMLLSSTFIFNGKTAIDEQSLNTMSLMLEFCKKLQVGSEEEGDVSRFFPGLLWVIRDFALKPESDDGEEITMTRYLADALTEQKGASAQIEIKNRNRRLIKSLFRERDCFGLIRPTEDERTLHNLTNDSQLRPEFLVQLADLSRLLMKKLRPKTMKESVLNGEMLAALAVTYVDAINSGGIPNIQGAWTNVCQAENRKLVSECETNYEAMLEEELGDAQVSEAELQTRHSELKHTVLAAMLQKSVGSKEEVEPYLAQVKQKLKEKFVEVKKKKEKAVIAQCESLVKAFGEETVGKMRKGEYTQLADFKKDLETFIRDVRAKTPLGPAAEVRLRDLTEKLTLETVDYLHRTADTEKTNELRRLTESVSQLQAQLIAKKEDHMKEKETIALRLQDLEKENFSFRSQVATLSARSEDSARERARLEENFRSQLADVKESAKEQLEFIKKQYADSQGNLAEATKTASKEQAELTRDLMLSRQEAEYRNKEVEELKRKRAELEDDARATRSEIARLKAIIETQDAEIRKLKSQLSSKPEAVEAPTEWTSERTQLRGQVEMLRGQLSERQNMQDFLMTALQTRSTETPRHTEKALETATNLSAALERNEHRTRILEEKVEKLKRFKKMVRNCSALQCRLCGKTFSSTVFGAHVTVCLRDSTKAASIPTTPMNINITQATVKEGADSRSFTEYLITVSYRGKSWSANRRYKLFGQLNEQLEAAFPSVEMPEAAQMFSHQSINLVMSNSKPKSIDERRRLLQAFLTDLSQIPAIRESWHFGNFIGADLYFPEEFSSHGDERSSRTHLTQSSEDLDFP